MNNPMTFRTPAQNTFGQLSAVPGGRAANSPNPLIPLDQLALRWRLDKRGLETEVGRANVLDQREESVAVNAVNMITLSAITSGASDVRISYDSTGFNLQFKINGMWSRRTDLIEHLRVSADTYKKIVSRLKLLSDMDISRRHVAQDGGAKIEVFRTEDGKKPALWGEYKLRAATVIDRKSTDLTDAEAMVFRVLSSAKPRLVDDLVPPHIAARIEEATAHSTGIVVVCGPTGSGKTTTLYSILGKLNDGSRNIVTIEDPIEYEFPSGVIQTQVNRAQGVTFETFTANVLRLAPDIILVGETRNPETASAAISVANTGHLVFTTVHADDSAAGIGRLLDLGAEDYLIRDTVRAVIAQRLVPELCTSCREPEILTASQLAKLNHLETRDTHIEGYKSSEKGCECCRNTGIQGRRGVYEVLLITPQVAKLIVGSGSNPLDVSAIRNFAREQGMSSLSQELALLVESGAVDYRHACKVAGIVPGLGVVDMEP